MGCATRGSEARTSPPQCLTRVTPEAHTSDPDGAPVQPRKHPHATSSLARTNFPISSAADASDPLHRICLAAHRAGTRRVMPILLAIGIPLGLLALYVATRPSHFRIARSRTINAPASTVFGLIQDFHAWEHWSPWEKLDSSMKKTYGGPATGKGANYHWVGNNKVGEGKMTITDTVENARVEVDLNFIKPFAANNKTTFTLDAEGDTTRVTWAMEGERNFVMKAFGVFMNMDDLVGKDFDKGLDAMASAATVSRETRVSAAAA